MVRYAYRLLMFVVAMCFAIACAEEVHRHSDSGPCLQCLFEDAERRRAPSVGQHIEAVPSISVQAAQREPKTPEVRIEIPSIAIAAPRPVLVLTQRAVFRAANRILGPPPPRPIEPADDVGTPRAPPTFE